MADKSDTRSLEWDGTSEFAYNPATARQTILACLARIRRRLWGVRLVERMTLGIACGAALAAIMAGAWLLHQWNPGLAVAGAALGLAPAAWLWWRAKTYGKGVLTPALVRIAAILMALVSVAVGAMCLITAAAVVPIWAISSAVVGIFLIAAAVSVRMIDRKAAAIFVDQQAGLEERVATALELLDMPAPGTALEAAFRAPVIESAVAACHQVKRARVGYRRLNQRAYAVAAVMVIAAIGVSMLTPLPARVQPINRKFVQVAESAKKLADVIKEIEQKKPENEGLINDKIKPLEAKLAELKKGDMSPIEASALLNEAKNAMQRDQAEMQASDKVQEALKAMEQTKNFAQAEDPLKNAKMSASSDPNSSARQQSAKEGLDQAAQDLADKMKSGGASKDDQKKLAEGLREAAKQAGADSQLQKDLENAAADVEKGDADQMAKDLQAAGSRMSQQQADRAMSQDAINRAMSEIDQMAGSGMSKAEQEASNNNQSDGGQNGNSGEQGGGQGAQANSGQGDGQNQGQPGGGGQQGAPGQDGTGEGKSAMQGSAQSGQGESSKGGVAQGNGSTNLEQKGGPGDKNQGNEIGKIGTFVKIYDQHDFDSHGNKEKVTGAINPLGPAAGTSHVLGNADKTDAQIKSYRDELPGAKQRVMDDLNRQAIPPEYQDMVRSFYQSDEEKQGAK